MAKDDDEPGAKEDQEPEEDEDDNEDKDEDDGDEDDEDKDGADGEDDEDDEDDIEGEDDDDEGEDGNEGAGGEEDAAGGEDGEDGEDEPLAPKKRKRGKKKKAGPDKKRVYKCKIFDVKFENHREEPPVISPWFEFTLGGKIKVVDKRDQGGGLEETRKEGPRFVTDTCLLIDYQDVGVFKDKKKLYWKGTYADLAEQDLKIVAAHRPPCCQSCGFDRRRGCFREDICELKCPLRKIAGGSVGQEFEIWKEERGVGKVTWGILRFNMLFEEIFDFQLEFVECAARDLHAADEGGTSDPYVNISIKGDWKKLFTKGGFYGREVQTEKEYNTLFPKWPELPKPLYYNGTWSELQNEILMIKVFDFDLIGSDELIGWARIPLSGQFRDLGDTAEAYIQSGLAFTDKRKEEVLEGKFEMVKVVVAQGDIKSFVRIERMPKYKQLGAPMKLQSGVQYMGVEVVSCGNLPSTDENGYTDAFVVLEWEKMEQKTKVVEKNLNPVFKEKLYFPLLLFKFSAEEIAKKENFVQLKIYDFDPDGSCDVLGFAEFGLHEITLQKESEVDGQFARHLEKTISIEKCRSKSATVTIRAWFQPHPLEDEDEEEIFLLAPQEKSKKTIDDTFKARAEEWTQGIRQCAPRAYRKANALTGFQYSAFDEKSCEHFLPCYLMPLQGPLDLQNPKEVFRMVSCIMYESDKDVLDDDDAWASPKFFLDIKKGDEEDHAILLCNLFLGLSIDSYMCVGHGKIQWQEEFSDEVVVKPTDEQHVWVMTRNQDGSVVFWECMNSREYPLLKRWKGADGDDESSEESADENEAEADDGDEDDKVFSAFYEDDVMLSDQRIHASDIFLDDDDVMGVGVGDDESDEEEDLFLIKPYVLPPYHSIHVVFNHENVWANLQNLDPTKCLYEIDNAMQWKPFCSFEEGFSPESDQIAPFYKAPTIPTRFKKDRTNKLKADILEAVKEGVKDLREQKMLESKIWEPDAKEKGQTHMQHVLSKGLRLMEDRLLANDERKQDNIAARLNSWKGELIKSAPPLNLSFEGIPVNFSYFDAKRIRKRICSKYEEFLTDPEQDVQYCFGCHVAPYYCTVNSTWLYITKLKPLNVDDDSDED